MGTPIPTMSRIPLQPASSRFEHYSGAHHLFGNSRRPILSFQTHLMSSISSIPKVSLLMIPRVPLQRSESENPCLITCDFPFLNKKHYASKVKTTSLSLQTLTSTSCKARGCRCVVEPGAPITDQVQGILEDLRILYEVSMLC